jgi:uncharacterized protein YndB with AHSA1/START domain
MIMASNGALEVTTPSDTEIRITREFAAPRRLVYDAFTKPELVRRWLGSMPGWEWVECEMDVRVGGRFRWLWRGPEGAEMGMRGEYREVVPTERIVNTEKFDEAWYPGEATETAVFTERAGRTTVTTSIMYESKEARDGVLQTPMAEGMESGYRMLDQVLAADASV